MFKSICLIVFAVICFSSCSKEDNSLYGLLKNKYSNQYVNQLEKKNQIIQSFKNTQINNQNINQIFTELNKLGDGHVYLQKINEELYKYKTDLKFIPGTQFISVCNRSCRPILNGKFKIEEIDGMSLLEFYSKNSSEVFASSEQGKYHRTFQQLQASSKEINHKLKLQDFNGKKYFVDLSSVSNISNDFKCVDGKRLNDHQYYISVNTLWCNQGGKIEDEKKIFKEFEAQWNLEISKISESDEIVLDLRENNGGGDNEVMLILNTFIDHSVVLYKYQYLKTSMYSKKEWIAGILQFKNTIWGKMGIDYTNQKIIPIKRLFNNKIKTLVSPGCFSSCEGLAGNLKVHKRSILYGTTTHGGAGDPKMYKIDGSDYLINLPSCLVWLANDELIEGKGIAPNYLVSDSFQSSQDDVLLNILNN